MRLAFLHGPPAAGKLTVAKALLHLVPGRLFDNHAAIDVARTVFDFGTPGFWELVQGDRAALSARRNGTTDVQCPILSLHHGPCGTRRNNDLERYSSKSLHAWNGTDIGRVELFVSRKLLVTSATIQCGAHGSSDSRLCRLLMVACFRIRGLDRLGCGLDHARRWIGVQLVQ